MKITINKRMQFSQSQKKLIFFYMKLKIKIFY